MYKFCHAEFYVGKLNTAKVVTVLRDKKIMADLCIDWCQQKLLFRLGILGSVRFIIVIIDELFFLT